MGGRIWTAAVLLALGAGCVTARPKPDNPPPQQEIQFDPIEIKADLELLKLNDEELFAQGTATFGAKEYEKAARYFDRLVEAYPKSPHRGPSLYNAGLSHEKLEQWEEARLRFAEIADPVRGTGDALDAAFRSAETLYHLGRFDEAEKLLATIAGRTDLNLNKRLEAQVQQGICQLEAGRKDDAEATLRKTLATYQELPDKGEVDDYFPAQAQFFLGEIYRLHCEAVLLDPDKGADQLTKDLEYKAELLLSAQGHYLRSIRMGNGYWATAAGAQIGGLYEGLYETVINSSAPKELTGAEAEIYRQELRKKVRVLVTKAITIYERTLEAAERIGAQNTFVEKTKLSLQKMRDLLMADAEREEQEAKEAEPHKAPRLPPKGTPKKPGALKEPRIEERRTAVPVKGRRPSTTELRRTTQARSQSSTESGRPPDCSGPTTFFSAPQRLGLAPPRSSQWPSPARGRAGRHA